MDIIEKFIKTYGVETPADFNIKLENAGWRPYGVVSEFTDYLTSNGYEIVKKEECECYGGKPAYVHLEGCRLYRVKKDVVFNGENLANGTTSLLTPETPTLPEPIKDWYPATSPRFLKEPWRFNTLHDKIDEILSYLKAKK